MKFPPNVDLLNVPLYSAGKSIEEIQEEYGLTDLAKLASNESPAGPSPMAVEAARRALAEAHRYPGLADRDLRRRIGALAHPGFDERNVITGNGATDVIRMLALGFTVRGAEVVTADLTFPMYQICATMFGGVTVRVPVTAELRFDLPGIAKRIGPETRLVYLCSPNNPTGLVLRRREIEAFMALVPEHVTVAFDESYRDFADHEDGFDPCELVAAGRDVVVIRSFSKSAGLANLRVGYAISTPEIIGYLRHAQLPLHIGAPAVAAAMASLLDHEFHARCRALVQMERTFLCDGLDRLNVKYVPSQANFVLLIDLPVSGMACYEGLLRQGVIVRPMEPWGLPHAVRVSVGTREQNARFITALGEVLSVIARRATSDPHGG
jgi:histidinol-phosphate aminotransferase